MVNVGNPHFVLFVDTEDFSAHGHGWQELGSEISTSPLFPHGTNVEFVRVLSKAEIAFRIFERGCGPTTSSGTGTCASSAAAMALRGVERELTAVAEGGAQRTVWPAADAVMQLTGPAEIVCRGRGCCAVTTAPEAVVKPAALDAGGDAGGGFAGEYAAGRSWCSVALSGCMGWDTGRC